MGPIPTAIFVIRTLNIFFLFYLMLNNCSTITTKEIYKPIFYIDLAYKFLSFAATFIITFWKKCLKKYNLFVFILIFINYAFYFLVLFSLISNFMHFNSYYYECPYIRLKYEKEDINNNNTYRRTCITYSETINSNIYQYICFYNSTDEYINKYYDGIFSRKDDNIPQIINKINCQYIHINNITNNDNNRKIMEYISKTEYKDELFLCSRKTAIDKNNNLIGNKCPDENPIKSYIFGIYAYLCSCFLECLFFIFLYFYLKKKKKHLEIKLKKEKKKKEIPKNNYTTSDKDQTNNTNQNENNTDNVEDEYNQGENILTIGIEQTKYDYGSKSLSDIRTNNDNKLENLKETNTNLIKIKSSIKENADMKDTKDNENNKSSCNYYATKPRKIKRLLSEDTDINAVEGQGEREKEENK